VELVETLSPAHPIGLVDGKAELKRGKLHC
jgi:hypothetical protein